MFSNLKIRTKLLLSGVLIISIFGLAGIIISKDTERIISAIPFVPGEIEELEGIQNVRIELEKLHRMLATSVLEGVRPAGLNETLTAIESGFDQSVEAAEGAAELGEEGGFEDEEAEEEEDLILFESYRNSFAEIHPQVLEIVSFAENGERAKALAVFEDVTPLFERLEERLAKHEKIIEGQIQARLNEIIAIAESTKQTVSIALLMSFFVSLIVLFAFSHVMAKRILVARNAAVEIARGNMDAEIDISGKDEVAELSQAIEKMRDSLKVVLKEFEKKIK